MNSYSIWLSVHVVTAILGLGQLVGTLIIASSTPTRAPVTSGTLTALRRLGLGTTAALAIMLVSGGLLERAGGGAFHTMLWFRASFILLIALGALQGWTRRTLRQVERGSDGRGLRGVARLSGAMCVVVAVIAILMETKP